VTSFFKLKVPDTGGLATLFTTAAGVPGLDQVQYRGYSSQRSRIELRVLDEMRGRTHKPVVIMARNMQSEIRMKENAKNIRALWRKYKGLSSILAECMQRAIGASMNDRKRMLEEEFPEQAKEE